MKTPHFIIILVALACIGAGVWYPTFERMHREELAKVAAAKAKRVAPLKEASDILEGWEGFKVPLTAAERFEYTHFKTFKVGIRLSELSREAHDDDSACIRNMSEIYLAVYDAIKDEPSTDDAALTMVRTVNEQDEQFNAAKEAIEKQLAIVSAK